MISSDKCTQPKRYFNTAPNITINRQKIRIFNRILLCLSLNLSISFFLVQPMPLQTYIFSQYMASSLKSPQNKSRLHMSHNQFICDICYNHYNRSERIPLVICLRQHQMCSYCIRAIKKSKKCPFCRQVLDLSNIKINKPLVRRLTNDPNEPNVRHEILQQSRFYISQSSSEDASNLVNQEFFIEVQEEQQIRIHYMIEETQRKRNIIYLGTIFLVLPFFILDFYFGFINSSQPQCTYVKKLFGLMNLQSWFIIISLLQGSYLLMFFMSVINHKCRRRQFDSYSLSSLQEVYLVGILVKGLVCCVVELFLFFGVILSGCRGSVYGYGISLAVLHMVKLFLLTIGMIKNACC